MIGHDCLDWAWPARIPTCGLLCVGTRLGPNGNFPCFCVQHHQTLNYSPKNDNHLVEIWWFGMHDLFLKKLGWLDAPLLDKLFSQQLAWGRELSEH